MRGKVRKECILASSFAYCTLRWLEIMGAFSSQCFLVETEVGKSSICNIAVVLIWFCRNADIFFFNIKAKRESMLLFVWGASFPSVVDSLQTIILEPYQRDLKSYTSWIWTHIKNLPNVVQLYGGLTGQTQTEVTLRPEWGVTCRNSLNRLLHCTHGDFFYIIRY